MADFLSAASGGTQKSVSRFSSHSCNSAVESQPWEWSLAGLISSSLPAKAEGD